MNLSFQHDGVLQYQYNLTLGYPSSTQLNNLMNVDNQELLQACNLAWLTINPGTPKQSIEKELNRLEIKKDLEQ